MTQASNPVTWTMEDLYNLLMRGIEADLCTDTLPLLDVMYEGETEEQRKERMAVYAGAFRQFLNRYEKFTAALHGEFRKIQAGLRKAAEGNTRKHDQNAIASLEELFRNA